MLTTSLDREEELAARPVDVDERRRAEPADLGGVVRDEALRRRRAEAAEHPVEDGGERRVVERRLRDAGDAPEVLAPARHADEPPDRARERGHAARRPAA